jgi:chromosome segregation ATPase
MMVSSAPSQSTLSDLKVLLELLQAASDPKQAKKVIDSISEARKQYDDSITESQARLAAASEAEKKAEIAAAKAEMAADKADKKKAEAEAKAADVAEQVNTLNEERVIFDNYRNEIAAQAKANGAERVAIAQARADAAAKLASDRDAFNQEVTAFDAKVAEVAGLKAELEEKLAKLRELTS